MESIRQINNRLAVTTSGQIFVRKYKTRRRPGDGVRGWEELHPTVERAGYQLISGIYFEDRKPRLVHRLVAQTFILNPNNLPEVDHIDGNKTNNAAENLRWCTHVENMRYFKESGKQKSTLKGKDYTITVKVEDREYTFNSIKECIAWFISEGLSKTEWAAERGLYHAMKTGKTYRNTNITFNIQ